jgi:hypothetical protein
MKLYVITGMLYSASGWENGYYDCQGSLIVRGLALAKRVAKQMFLKGGYGSKGYFKAPEPYIEEFDKFNEFHSSISNGEAITYYNSRNRECIYL